MKRIIRDRLRRSVIVTLHDGQGFAGVLYEADSEAVVLRNAQALDVPDRGTIGVDGEVLILRDEIAYLQFP